MPELTLLIEYGYLILLAWVFADQAALPLPGEPILVGAGVLAGTGSLDIVTVLLVATGAALSADLAWYAIGKWRGRSILKFLCKLSLEPDYCVRQTGVTFQRYGPATLLVSNFVPGLQTLIPPLAGVFGVPFLPFAGMRLVGTVIWVATFVLPGYYFADQAAELLDQSSQVLTGIAVALVAALLAYIAYKFARRQWFLRALRVDVVKPEALKQELDDGALPHIVDLRGRLEIESFPHTIPGASVIPIEEIDDHLEALSQKRDLILYCT
ncbi:MAG: VTT domain-containing protein [Pseudomonadales bacterium]